MDNSMFTWLAKSLVSSNLESVCASSLNIISNASTSQINAAIKHNQSDINKLLVKLLTIDFISKNQDIIEKETKALRVRSLEEDKNGNESLKNYCCMKLLEISPIDGFFQNDYFLHYNISNDVRMHILTFIRPLELFRSISFLNKQFNENVKTMHQSMNEKYNKIFSCDNFTFESFSEMKKYCEKRINSSAQGRAMVDVEFQTECFKYGHVNDINSIKKLVEVTVPLANGGMVNCPGRPASQVAPFRSITYRPWNLTRFRNIIKRGYCSQTCDINIAKYCVTFRDKEFTNNNNNDRLAPEYRKYFHLTKGIIPIAMAQRHLIDDVWVCGQILFHRVSSPGNNGQIGVAVDISKIWYESTPMIQHQITLAFEEPMLVNNNKRLLALTVHPDSSDIIQAFGNKTNRQEQLKAKQLTETCRFVVNNSKKMVLDRIGYRNYCVVTEYGPCNALENEKEFDLFVSSICRIPKFYDNEIVNQSAFDVGVLSKMIFEENKNGGLELRFKMFVEDWMLDFKDDTAPEPLKKRYCISYSGSNSKIIDATVSDARLENINSDINDIDGIKNELLQWKGFVRIKLNITKEFNQFQERLIDESNGKIDELVNNNRKYFVNSMPCLEWDQENDKIMYHSFVFVCDINTAPYNFKINYFDWLQDTLITNKNDGDILSVLKYMLRFVDEQFVLPVCTKWNGNVW